MFNLKRKEEEPSVIDPVVDTLIDEMKTGYSDEFRDQAHALKLLMEAKAAEPKPDRVSLNTAAGIAANLAGIAMILIFEKNNVITTKSLSFISKLKS